MKPCAPGAGGHLLPEQGHAPGATGKSVTSRAAPSINPQLLLEHQHPINPY